MEDLIRERLTNEFSPVKLVIENQSHLHARHPMSPNSGHSHFRVLLQSHCLKGLSRVDQQRRVYAALGDAFNNGLHALSLEILPL